MSLGTERAVTDLITEARADLQDACTGKVKVNERFLWRMVFEIADMEHLRRSILEPKADVPREYWLAKITLGNGSNLTGQILTEDTYSVQILEPSKGLLSLSKRDLKRFDTDKGGAMPSYQGKLSDSELNDVVAYLWSLRRSGRSQ